jgi:hypothetical protein
MKTVDLVVARCAEDLQWLKKVTSSSIFVMNCGEKLDDDLVSANQERGGVFVCPNQAREAGLWMRFIIQQYPDFSDVVVFAQGHPFDHVGDFIKHIEPENMTKDFDYIGGTSRMYSERTEGEPGMVAMLDEFFGANSYPAQFPWQPGAQFYISRELLNSRPKEYYERLFQLILSHDRSPWCAERAWFILIGK